MTEPGTRCKLSAPSRSLNADAWNDTVDIPPSSRSLELMDTMPEGEMMEHVRAAAIEVPGVLAIDKSYARKTGFKCHVDLLIENDTGPAVSSTTDKHPA